MNISDAPKEVLGSPRGIAGTRWGDNNPTLNTK